MLWHTAVDLTVLMDNNIIYQRYVASVASGHVFNGCRELILFYTKM